ncbi:MAG: biopolymer transporter ExbD [Sandaracinaceae bacterium]|nr:biopolymer transporter ExbD [Sandaracinaceae bacterium]
MGASGGGGEDEEIITAINVTPLVDIVLVLLIILMVTASYIVSKSIPMDLPNAVTGDETPPRQLTVSINRENQLYVDAEEVTWEQLRARARQFASEEREARAVIAADRAVSHGEFIRVIDILREVGIVRYAINVNPREESP